MTPNLCQQAKDVMSAVNDGQVYRLATSATIPKYLQNLNFFNMSDEVVFHYKGIDNYSEDRNLRTAFIPLRLYH